jgi:hypothetical protein
MMVLLERCYMWKVYNAKIEIISFVINIFFTRPHCQMLGVGQGMKQTYLDIWYALFQAECDRCDQHNHHV